MNLFEDAVMYSTVMHSGTVRKNTNSPYILHPLEVAQIISTITDDIEIITAGVLHDVVEDTDGTIEEIRLRFGKRVADLVSSETENKYEGLDRAKTWQRRKEESLLNLKNAKENGVKILWLADKLSNLRSLFQMYSEIGEETWDKFNQKDPMMHQWYYKTIAEYIEMDLNRMGAFKEYVGLINCIWPGTFAKEKSKYKKFKEMSVEGCPVIGVGAKGKVYRYNDELVVKVYNEKNLYKDIEKELFLARTAFVAGIPTAIPFGIVTVGESYASVFELLNSNSISEHISRQPSNVAFFAKEMAELARQIHSIDGSNLNLPSYMDEVYSWIHEGIECFDEKSAKVIRQMLDDLPDKGTLIHGDFHTGNVMEHNGEYLLIDMGRLSVCHPIIELSGVYMFYVGLGEVNPLVIESFKKFSYDVSKAFFESFLTAYLSTEDKTIINDVKNKAALLCYVRMIRSCNKLGLKLSEEKRKERDLYYDKVMKLLDEVDSLDF